MRFNTLVSNTAIAVAGSTFVVGIVVGILALISTSILNETRMLQKRGTIEARLTELSSSMRSSAGLVEELSAELDARKVAVRKLQEEAATAEALAELHKEQADAVRSVLDTQLKTSVRRIRGDSIKIGVASFVAGGGVSFLVTLLVHPLH